MSQATRPNDRHIIWSNQNLDVDDWREDYKEFLEANELDDDPNDEQALYEWMEETNYDYRLRCDGQFALAYCDHGYPTLALALAFHH